MFAAGLQKCSSGTPRSYPGTEVAVPGYNFVKPFDFSFNMIEGRGKFSAEGLNFPLLAPTE